MNADNHEQPLVLQRMEQRNCSTKSTNSNLVNSELATERGDVNEGATRQKTSPISFNGVNKRTSSSEERKQPAALRASDKLDTRGLVKSEATSQVVTVVTSEDESSVVVQQTCDPTNFTTGDRNDNNEHHDEKRSRLSWLTERSNNQLSEAASANQLKRLHSSKRCMSFGQRRRQQQVQQEDRSSSSYANNHTTNEAGGCGCPIKSQVATSDDNRRIGDISTDNQLRDVSVKTTAYCQDEPKKSQVEFQSLLERRHQEQLSSQAVCESQTDYQVAANDPRAGSSNSSSSSLLFWKFLSNLPTSITQRGRSSPGLAPEVAGYLANRQRQQQCDCKMAPSMTASTSTGAQKVSMDDDETRPPPYDGCRSHQNPNQSHQQHQAQAQHQEMIMMNYSGGPREAASTASGSRVIRIVAPQPEPAQISTTSTTHGTDRDHRNLQSTSVASSDPRRDRLSLTNEHEQLAATNRTKLSIASSRTTTRSSGTSLSSCILSDSSASEAVRLKWGKKMDFLLSIIGFAVDLANIWRFPYLVYKNGGGVFLIPYLTMLIFGGIPLFFLELCLGQFVKKGPITVWNKICPSMKGVGYCSIMISWYVSFYYNVLIAWSVYFIYRSLLSFGDKMPWEDCDNSWNSKGTCVSISQLKELCSHRDVTLETCRKELFDTVNVTSPASEFFVKELSQIDQSTGLDDMGYLRWELVFCTMIVYLLHYFSLFRGLETSGKVVWVTATAPYMILSILLVRGLFLPGATVGIQYYLSPRLEKLADPQVWIDAAGQVFYSIGVGFGVHLTYASFNSHNNNCYRDCLMTSAVNAATSVYSGLVVFVYLGYMAENLGIEIDKVASEGYSLVFEVYPEALTTLPFARFWSILFFIMLLTLGIDSAMGGLEAVITGLEDEFKFARRLSRGQLTGLVIVSSFLPALISCTQGGAYTLFWFDIYSAGVSLLFSALFETIGVVYCYGLNKFIPNIESMLGRKPPLFYILCWKIISPIFLVGVILMSILTAGVPTYRGYTFPLWSIILGWCLAFSSVAAIPIVAIWYWINRCFLSSSLEKSGRKRDRGSSSVASSRHGGSKKSPDHKTAVSVSCGLQSQGGLMNTTTSVLSKSSNDVKINDDKYPGLGDSIEDML